MQRPETEYRFSVQTSEQVRGDADLLAQWETIIAREQSINRLYASPVWFEHLVQTSSIQPSLAAVYRGDRLVGVCTVQPRPHELRFAVGTRTLGKVKMRAVAVMGCEPLLPDDPAAWRGLYGALFRSFASDCIYLENVPTQSPAWSFLQGDGRRSNEYTVYVPRGVRPWYWLNLGGSFEQYLATKSGKTRSNLRRHMRDLRDQYGEVILHRTTAEDQVGPFLRQAKAVSEKSWQHRLLGERIGSGEYGEDSLADLARRGVLRSYLLTAGDRPCAFVFGHQHDKVFQYAEIGFDESLPPSASPGKVLLYLLIEDLCKHDPPVVLNFGVGDAQYKQHFGNGHGTDAAVTLCRRTAMNYLRLAAHSGFYSAVDLVKKVVRRKAVK